MTRRPKQPPPAETPALDAEAILQVKVWLLDISPMVWRRLLTLHAYIAAAGIAEDKKGWLFRTAKGHRGAELSDRPMGQADAWCMVRRRALAAGIMAPIGNHSFRATGITAYLANGGTLEHAQAMAAHESPRTTKLYDRTKERLTQDEVERIRL
jgi:integrase